ncbi:MAG: ATP-dependent DNA helicase [Actinomycetales bacterium]
MPDLTRDALTAAVAAVGGAERPGQVAMAEAVTHAMQTGEHLLVQAGTGTGKSLAYLVPAILHAVDTGTPVVVATATIALQQQIVARDLPRVTEALAPLLPRRATFGMVKGRHNYVCVNRLEGGLPDDDEQDSLFAASATSVLGREVMRVREWAQDSRTGDRDELQPGVSDRAWSQVAVSGRDCLGSKCPVADRCFVEAAREQAKEADVVVTNHALLAIATLEGHPILPEHDVVVIDEGHELVDRVTGASTDELSAGLVDRAVKRAARVLGREHPANTLLQRAGEKLEFVLAALPDGRIDRLPDNLTQTVAEIRETAREVMQALSAERSSDDAAKLFARSGVEPVHSAAERIAAHGDFDVVWLTQDERRGPVLHAAPLAVNGLLRVALFDKHTVVLTSATLTLGGAFDGIARSVGLSGEDDALAVPASAVAAALSHDAEAEDPDPESANAAVPSPRSAEPANGEEPRGRRSDSDARWRGLDVGSPFDYRRQGILYVAKHLPPPGRDGTSPAVLEEIVELIAAAGGRTLGLFSSMRAAKAAAEAVRTRPELAGITVACQGEDRTSALVSTFAEDATSCLFGTLSLWQGVDVPGEACSLVLIDRIPFPRPDDPLASARARAVERAGGNGFMTVSASYAALRLAQGVGRLIRRSEDRGVVAVLDPRLSTARYGGFLRASLPPFWSTNDPQQVRTSLRALATAADARLAAAS